MVTSPNTITIGGEKKNDEMDRECATQEAEEKCIQGLVDKPEERGQLGKSRHIYGAIILKWFLTKQKWEVVNCFTWLMIVTSSRVL
jgi:hypothetical protein